MPQSHTYGQTLRFREDAETTLVTTHNVAITDDFETNIDALIPANTVVNGFSLGGNGVGIGTVNIKSIYMLASTNDLVIKTNSVTVPNDTINLTADEPFYWHEDLGTSVPLSADLEIVIADNSANTTAATPLKVRILAATA